MITIDPYNFVFERNTIKITTSKNQLFEKFLYLPPNEEHGWWIISRIVFNVYQFKSNNISLLGLIVSSQYNKSAPIIWTNHIEKGETVTLYDTIEELIANHFTEMV